MKQKGLTGFCPRDKPVDAYRLSSDVSGNSRLERAAVRTYLTGKQSRSFANSTGPENRFLISD